MAMMLLVRDVKTDYKYLKQLINNTFIIKTLS